MAILELRAARRWSRQQTADVFLVTAATIASWMKRVDEEGPDALVQLREPVNKFPEFVRYAVRLLKALCPGQDCPDVLPGRAAPRHDHGRPYAQGEAHTGVVTV